MCWGSLAVVLEVSEDGLIAKVDYGDGVVREVLIGISEDKIRRGDVVIVHAGVIVSKITREGLMEHINLMKELLGERVEELSVIHEKILRLIERIEGGEA